MRRIALLLCLMFALSAMPTWADDPSFASPPARQTWFHSWKQQGRSGEGRPIETLQIGRGPFRTLVLGSMHGSEPMSVEMAARLATHLGNMSDHWHEFNVLIVKTPNPDGYARGSNWNASGIDLNRNFPSSIADNNIRDAHSGASKFSEVESRFMQMLIDTYRPHRIVHIKSTPNDFGWALCSQRAQAVSSYLGEFRNLRVGQWERHRVAGSIEDYSANARNLEAVTLAVPNGFSQTIVWRDYRNTLLAAAAYVDPGWQTTPRHAHIRGSSPTKYISRDRNEPGRGGRSIHRRPISNFWRSPQRRRQSLPVQIWPSDATNGR